MASDLDLSVPKFQALLQNLRQQRAVIVVKFGATWCGPCKVIKPYVEQWSQQQRPVNVLYIDVDIDETMDLYMALKKYKMVNGVPVLLAFYSDSKTNLQQQWFIPDDSHVGGDVAAVQRFLGRVTQKAQSLLAA
jgi:thioredoxin 1